MCLIAYRYNPDTFIDDDVIEYNLRTNPDGFGLAWRDPEAGLTYQKFAPSAKDKFVELIRRLNLTDMEFVAHWRKATSGRINEEMSHPFHYEDKDGHSFLAFHNGIINIKTDPGASDTFQFVHGVLGKLPFGWWNDAAMSYLVETSIGWSRFIILDFDDPAPIFLNREDWKEDDGVLYSTSPRAAYSSTYKGKTTTPLLPANVSAEEDDCGVWGCAGPHRTQDHTWKLAETWKDKGHQVYPVTQLDAAEWGSADDDDYYGQAKCEDCGVQGEYYIIEGIRYIDIEHEEEVIRVP